MRLINKNYYNFDIIVWRNQQVVNLSDSELNRLSKV